MHINVLDKIMKTVAQTYNAVWAPQPCMKTVRDTFVVVVVVRWCVLWGIYHRHKRPPRCAHPQQLTELCVSILSVHNTTSHMTIP